MHWVVAIICLICSLAIGAAFRDKTGVDMPSNRAMRGIRRRARKAGINEWDAYAAHIARKQKRLANPTPKRPRKPKKAL